MFWVTTKIVWVECNNKAIIIEWTEIESGEFIKKVIKKLHIGRYF